MLMFTTCRGCGDLLHVTDGIDHHNGEPPCVPKRTEVERLAAEFLDAAEAGDTRRADELQARIDELDARPPRLLDAALTYARWGWPVFPLRANSKQPATRHGCKDATIDTDRIRDWWIRRPADNVGIATGNAFDVIDIDVPTGIPGYVRLLEHLAADSGRPLESHGMVATASGGIHHYITPTGGSNRAGLLPGIDFRGNGGYVVAPPSTLGTRGRSWSWTILPSPAIKGPR